MIRPVAPGRLAVRKLENIGWAVVSRTPMAGWKPLNADLCYDTAYNYDRRTYDFAQRLATVYSYRHRQLLEAATAIAEPS